MFCNKCGAQLPDDAVFCGSCGSSLKPAAPAAAPTTPTATAAPAPAPAYTAPAATPYSRANYGTPKANHFGGMSSAAAAGGVTLFHWVAIAACALVAISLIFFPWVGSPYLADLIAYAKAQAATLASTLGSSSVATLSSLTSPEFGVLGIVGLTDIASSLNSVISILASAAGSSSSTATITSSMSQVAGEALILKLYFVLWIADIAVMVLGAYKALTSPNHDIKFLRIALIAAAVLCLIWVIVIMMISGTVDTNLTTIKTQLLSYGINITSSSLGVTIWTWIALVLSVLGAVCTFLVRK